MGKMAKQYGGTGKSLENPLKMLKKFRVGGKKLGPVRLPETHNFFLILSRSYCDKYSTDNILVLLLF